MAKHASRNAVPIVFISSTSEDLKPYRAAARDAAIGCDCLPRMMEYFVASGEKPPFDTCMAKVSEANVLVVIIAHRFGWVPPDQPAGEPKSITWLECDQALADGDEVLAFLVDEGQPWSEEQREEFAVTKAVRDGKATPILLETVQRNVHRLREFKDWLNGRGIRAKFTAPEDLRGKVSDALHDWLRRHSEFSGATAEQPRRQDPSEYLRQLRTRTAHIEIRGLEVGTGRAHRFAIEELFVTLTTGISVEIVSGPLQRLEGKVIRRGDPKRLLVEVDFLQRAASVEVDSESLRPLNARGERHASLAKSLAERRVLAIGDPGAGKTTFLRFVACSLCQTLLGEVPNAAEARLGLQQAPLPILVRISDLVEHIEEARRGNVPGRPTNAEDPGWLAHYLAAAGREPGWGLDEEFFSQRLRDGNCLVMLDGLDEAPDRVARGSVAKLIENLAGAYEKSTIFVTSRPAAMADEVLLPGFTHVPIDPLDDDAIRTFLSRWCEALVRESPADAAAHRDELLDALSGRPDIRRMARNPVMLTALAVVHWNERRLPEQRADLYDSIIKWLSRSREQRPGRLPAERTVALLQELALAMHDHPKGRQVQVPKRWAAEALAPEIEPGTRKKVSVTKHTIERAEKFLDEEENDSGIVVRRGNEIRFWHLSFQEFLAAKAVAGRTDDEQHKLLFGKPKRLYVPEWREVVLLLAGVLHEHGRLKVDALVTAMLGDLGSRPKLADQARCAGLLGAMLRDLGPLRYETPDARYHKLLDDVLAIFDAKRSASVPTSTRIEAAEALGQAGDPRLEPNHPKRWVPIPAGKFRMGSQTTDLGKPNHDPEADQDELPVHEVTLDAFSIGRFLVTVGEFEQFVEHGGYAEKQYWKADGYGQFKEPEGWPDQLVNPNRPIVGVSWYESAAFAAWAGCRLPTEAEWERAARGTEGRKFPWGNEPVDPARLNYSDSKIHRPTPVGIYPLGATPDGIYDMLGNVWEWCHDWFDEKYYSKSPSENPQGPEKGDLRVLRGGSDFGEARGTRSADRDGCRPVYSFGDIGFRVVRGVVGVRTL